MTGLTSASQQETISAGPAAQLVFTTGTVSGTASVNATLGPITVQEQDAYGNVTTTALSVNLTSTSAGPYEFAATSGGTAIASVNIAAGNSTATFYYGDENSGTPVLTAAATGLTSGSQYETINVGTGTQLSITSTAFTGVANASATNAFTVTLEDIYGNPASKTTATTVNLTSTSTGTHDFAATSGGTALTSVTLLANTSYVTAYYGDEAPGTPTLTAAATGLTSATQQEAITAGTPAKLVFTTSPVSGSASNSATLGPITVEEQDAYGNVATSGGPTTVTLTSTSAGASFGLRRVERPLARSPFLVAPPPLPSTTATPSPGIRRSPRRCRRRRFRPRPPSKRPSRPCPRRSWASVPSRLRRVPRRPTPSR